MSQKVIASLNHSLSQLENAILDTKAVVAKMGRTDSNLMQRLDCYVEVLKKQRILAAGLTQFVREKNWQHISRTVELIKGSSLLIQLDTQSMISEITSKQVAN
jgi:hypothetical protein